MTMLQPIRTREEYEAALQRVQELRERLVPEEAEELEMLLALIAHYDRKISFELEGTTYVNTIYLDFTGIAVE
jgi:hypothetical protein